MKRASRLRPRSRREVYALALFAWLAWLAALLTLDGLDVLAPGPLLALGLAGGLGLLLIAMAWGGRFRR
jgi:hypothetical protein